MIARGTGPPGDDAAPGGSSSEGKREDEQQRAAGNRSVVSLRPTDETLCSMCLRRPRVGRWDWCRACLLDLVTVLGRRRDAADRCEPMADGRRDTLEPRRAS